jgi:hypothetical protein
MKQTLIKEYIRDKKNNPYGVAVAVKDETTNQVFYGFSICNKVDKYDKNRGIAIAVNRALSKDGYSLPESPATVRAIMIRFKSLEDRAVRYFKDIPQEYIRFDFGIEQG